MLFRSGVKIEFKNDGSWKDIKISNAKATNKLIQTLPVAFLEPAVQKTINSKWANSKIVEIDKSKTSYDIEFADGTELTVSFDGKITKQSK